MSYDNVGNLITDTYTNPTQGGGMAYDAENHMTSAVNGSHKYRYNADGKRVKRIIAGQGEFWMVYGMGGELVAEYNATSGIPAQTNPSKEYGYRGGTLLVIAEGSNAKWLMQDHLGSTRMEIALSGNLSDVTRHDYLPFGEELAGALRSGNGYGTATNTKQKFTGHERDGETGLDFMQARYYTSVQGRFTNPDPLSYWMLGKVEEITSCANPQKWNKYVYVLNNPLRYNDPLGLAEVSVWSELTDSFRKELEQRGLNENIWNAWSNDQRQQVVNGRASLIAAGVWNDVTSIGFGNIQTRQVTEETPTGAETIVTTRTETTFTPDAKGYYLAITTNKDIGQTLEANGYATESTAYNHAEGRRAYKEEGNGVVAHLVMLNPPGDRYTTIHYDSGGGSIFNPEHFREWRTNSGPSSDKVTNALAQTKAGGYLRGLSKTISEIDRIVAQHQPKMGPR